ncbi:MAG TPA: DMT family transporter [Sphingobacteriaceae bacterium]|nr:DMT family transporter [Sphingobacteriaceae bacterium]
MTVNRNLLILHLTVLVWGFTGILGNLITISATQLVWYRVLIAFVSLFAYFRFTGQPLLETPRNLRNFILTGALVGGHWVLFFESIKVSTVSVTLVCLSSVTLFTSLLEPLFYKRKISKLEFVTGIFVIIGIYLIFRFETQYIKGIILGLLCALMASLFSIANSKLVQNSDASKISFYEMIGAFLWISLYMLFAGGFNSGLYLQTSDILYLLLLGTVCTAGAYVAAVMVMKEISPFRVALASNLEPIYGIILAWLIFGEKEVMSLGFYSGAIIILVAVFLYPVFRHRWK